MMEWTTSLPDWEDRIVSRQSLVPVSPLFPEVAADAMDVFGALRMVDADGSPLMSEACLPWVNELVATMFGSYDPERKRRLPCRAFRSTTGVKFSVQGHKAGMAATRISNGPPTRHA